MGPIAKLGPAERSATVERLGREEFDVVVIGGGITGTGCALDASSRGLRTALIEAHDYAAGTSSRSTKLIHGGLRYLEQLNFSLVKEALTERALMLTELCPHLVHPVPFLYPLKRRVLERPYVGAGVLLYDTMGAGRRNTPMHRHLSKSGALAFAPDLRDDQLVGAIRYYDAQVDDARHTLAVARTAVQHGAALATHMRATGLRTVDGRVSGVHARDTLTGTDLTIAARRVINATGPWTDQIQEMAGKAEVRVRPSKGIHLVVPRGRLDLHTGLILRTEKSVLFTVPWGAHWIIGTTDTDWQESVDDVVATRADIDYLLDRLNPMLRRPLAYEDIVGVYAGLRPLLAATAGSTASLSREHTVLESTPGLISIGGGKYTTYRVMAEDAVDAAVAGLDPEIPPSPTTHLPLLGAVGYESLQRDRRRLADDHGISVDWVDHLLRRHGDLAEEVLALCDERPDLRAPLQGAPYYLRAEIVYAATHEGAQDLDDVLSRRTRIRIQVRDRGTAAAEHAAALIGEVLGWDEDRRAAEVERYRALVRADLEAERANTDAEAAKAHRERVAG